MPAVDLTDVLASGPQNFDPHCTGIRGRGNPGRSAAASARCAPAERLAAAQAEQIGIAEADWYPAITINGTLGWQADRLSRLVHAAVAQQFVGPSFQWNLLNYGRIMNNVRLQDAQFHELVTTYQAQCCRPTWKLKMAS